MNLNDWRRIPVKDREILTLRARPSGLVMDWAIFPRRIYKESLTISVGYRSIFARGLLDDRLAEEGDWSSSRFGLLLWLGILTALLSLSEPS